MIKKYMPIRISYIGKESIYDETTIKQLTESKYNSFDIEEDAIDYIRQKEDYKDYTIITIYNIGF